MGRLSGHFTFPAASRRSCAAGILCGALLGAVAAVAQTVPSSLGDYSIDQLLNARIARVYSASKYEQRVTQAPASVTIVSSDEIADYGYRTLADILRDVRGLYITYERNYSNLGVRGFDRPGDFNTRMLLLVDGHRMNDNLYDSALIGPEAILDVDLIDHVEVIRGPSSSIYGSNAFFGVIDVITKDGSDLNGWEISGAEGSFGTYKERLSFGRKFSDGVDLLISGSYSESDGPANLYFPEFDTPATNHGVAENADGERAGNVFARLLAGDWSFTAAWSRRDKHVPTASYGTVFDDGREWTSDRRTFADLKYSHDSAEADRTIMARFYYDLYTYHANYPYDFGGPLGPPFIVVTHDADRGSGAGAEFQLTQKLYDRHTLVVGSEFRDSLTLQQSNYYGDPRVYDSLSDNTGHSLGIYAQDEYVISSELRLNAGLRYDDFRDFGGTLNPRLGLIFNPTEASAFKLLFGRAYRAPNAYEQFEASPGYSKANPNLTPETIRTYEAVYEHYLSHDLRLGASLYYYDIDDLISQRLDPADGLLVFQNADTVTAQGVELEAEKKTESGWEAHASYALQRAEDGHTGIELNNSPRHLAKVNVLAPLLEKKLHAGLELQYTSSLKTLAGNRTGGFLLVNATLLSQKLAQHWDVAVSAYNLLDRHYSYPGSTSTVQDAIPQDGRSFQLKLTGHF